MKQAIQEYYEARIRLIKSIRKMNYRIRKIRGPELGLVLFKYFGQKQVIIKEMRRMDGILRRVLEEIG